MSLDKSIYLFSLWMMQPVQMVELAYKYKVHYNISSTDLLRGPSFFLN